MEKKMTKKEEQGEQPNCTYRSFIKRTCAEYSEKACLAVVSGCFSLILSSIHFIYAEPVFVCYISVIAVYSR
jgi:hypothetical protein